MAWLYLGLAAIFEIIFAVSMKASDGFTKPLASIITVVGVLGGIFFLTMAMKTIPVSLAYPIWTAVGALGTVIFGFLVFGEGLNAIKIFGLIAILAGIASLRAAA
ncbi:MAG: multidrug efflux SMR transporter [Pseudomonadota bacterium]